MKIEKNKGGYSNGVNWFCYVYFDSKTNNKIFHGLYSDKLWWGIGYSYHDQLKGFWLRNWI